MRLTLRYLVILVAVVGMHLQQVTGQNLVGSNVRLKPTTVPSFCNTGDIRIDQDDANKLKICRSNLWYSELDSTASFVASKAVITNGSGVLGTSTVSSTEVGYLLGVSSAIQTQLDGKQATITAASIAFSSLTNITSGTVLGRSTAGTGVIEQLTTLPLAVQANITTLGSITASVTFVDTAADVPTRKEMLTLSRINGSNSAGTNFRASSIAFKDSTTVATTYVGSIEGWRRDANNHWLGGLSFYLNQGGQATALTDMTEVMRINESASVVIYGLSASLPVFTDSGKALTNTGTVAVTNGGTGIAVGTSGGIPAFTGTTTITSSGLLTANQLIVGGGAGTAPKTLAAGSQYVPLTMGAAQPGYTALALDQAVATSGKLLIARGGTNNETLAVTNGGIVYADGSKLMTSAAGSSNQIAISGGAGAPTWTTTLNIAQGGTNNTTLAVTAGGAVYTDGSKVMATGAGTASQVLTSNGSSAPTWQNPPAGASMVTATSGIKTASSTGLWLQMTSASVAITTGRWMLYGSIQFDNNGTPPVWTQVGAMWAAANGVDNATAPAALTTATNLTTLSVQKATGAMTWTEPGTGTGNSEYMNVQPVLVSCASSCTAYLVPFAGFSGVATTTKITAFANAMQMSAIP